MINTTLKHKKLFSIFIAFMVIGGFIFFYTYFNIVAMVEGSIIWKKDFTETVDLINKYYNEGSHSSSTVISQEEILKDPNLLKRIQKDALLKMIDYKILMSELDGGELDWENDANIRINAAISRVEDGSKFENGIKELYGMDYKDFKIKVLLPQAQLEILSEELKKQNKNYEDWIKEERKTAEVKIFIDGLRWEEGEVQIAQ